MKIASIREVHHDFSRLLEWVANGEEVAITKRRKVVARLLPAARKKPLPVKMPDIAARFQKVFGKKTIPNEVMRKILDDNQGHY